MSPSALLATVVLVIAGCGGGSPSPPAPPPPPPIDPWAAARSAVDAAGLANVRVVIGDANGVWFDYEKGRFAADEQHEMASATKWLSALVIYRLIEQGVMRPDDRPQDYLAYWTADPADSRSRITLRQLLAFTSGFNNPPFLAGCTADGSISLQACVQAIYAEGIDSEPGASFAYGPEHLQIAAAMAEVATGQGFSELFDQSLRAGLVLSPSTDLTSPSVSNPRASAGARSTVNDYVKVLRALLQGHALADTSGFYDDNTAAPVTFLYRPRGVLLDWHYAQGAWRVCERTAWDASCEAKRVISSPGAFGWTPWIDATNGYFGLVAVEESAIGPATERAVDLMLELMPLVEARL